MPFNSRHIPREYAGGSVNGILRKGNYNANTTGTAFNAGEARQVDLLVFGYACKIFRDDDKARDIDQGKHLIPWMGDDTLKIDRYDVRGALSELAPYEPPPGGYGNRLDYLTAEEQRAEQLCEEERYLFLYNNEEDHILQQEEDLKRLKQESDGQTYSQVGFQYETLGVQIGPSPEVSSSTSANDVEEAEQDFVLPRNFEVPADLRLPETMKQHAIIEKTARFIASQGAQMEILLKAKQSNNVQFEFLNQDSFLNPYYKFVLNSFKNGTYPEDRTPKDSNSSASQNESGLSSPFPGSSFNNEDSAKPIITVPTIKYKPSANCAYTQLISKIKGVPLPTVIAEGNDDNTSDSNTPNTPVLLQYNGSTYVQAENEDSNSTLISNSNGNENSNGLASTTTSTSNLNDSQPQVEILKNSSALALAQGYSSYSESEAEEETAKEEEKKPPQPEPVLTFPIPPENLKNIIDKTAVYVIKNGRQFEETLRSKSDERFTFLLHDNEHYPYYLYKITGDPNAASKEEKIRKAQAVAAALMSKKLLMDKTNAPVSFSIKAKDDFSASSFPPALPQEPSDDEEETKPPGPTSNMNRTVPESVQKAIRLVESQLMARNAQMAGSSSAAGLKASSPKPNASNPLPANKNPMSHTKAEMERNALFEQQQQNRQKEMKKAEEKVKDKLAQIAREKLGGLLSKEKQLQLERKRKAMAFLNQIKGQPCEGPESTTNDEKLCSNDSDDSIHSIPITSFGPDEKSDDDDDGSDSPPKTLLRKDNLSGLNKNETKSSKTLTVTLSDDDDVQLISVSQGNKKLSSSKRRSRSRNRDKDYDHKASSPLPPSSSILSSKQNQKIYRKRSGAASSDSQSDLDSSSPSEDRYDENHKKKHKHRSESHKSSSTSKKSKKSSKSKKHSKKKSKKNDRERSRSPNDRRSHRSKTHYYDDSPSRTTTTTSSSHRRSERKRSYSSSSDNSSASDDDRHYNQSSSSHRSRHYKTAEKVSSSSSSHHSSRKHKERKHKDNGR